MKYLIISFILITLLIQSSFAQDDCTRLLQYSGGTPQTEAEYRIRYDSLRRYIELCAKNDDSYTIFPVITGAVQEYDPSDTSRYDHYRDWLLSVVYLNTTSPYYFCACVSAMASTYAYGQYHIPNASLAVINFLRSFKNCDDPGLEFEYSSSIKDRHQTWLNSGDTSKKEDTTLPPLDSIGLGMLLHHQGVTPSSYLPSTYLASASSAPNPFKTETTLSFTLNHMAYITIDVYDILGHKVWGSDHGSTMDVGDHQIRIDGGGIPSGTLYARISTGFGEVKTVKLVKE